ncbi:Signal peptidase I [hydrothermal vent metagenome]|uniref:signal peptidase I n=1 Tax=hydrothermal vent metagenome TaxID=652676 RepID=A0A3B1DNA9_9ZZZZ
MKKKKGIVREYAEAIITALLLALIIRAYVVQAFKIPSGSMIPTLLVGDHILVTKFIYGTDIPFTDKKILIFREPRRGDVVVFKYPKDPDRDFIKRVIGVGGDVVEERNKIVYVNGKPLDEPYIQHTDNDMRSIGMDVRDNFGPLYVPKGKLFVMGDNRDQSYDSRYWGFVDLNAVKGKAFIIYWSWDSTRHLPRLNRTGKLIK